MHPAVCGQSERATSWTFREGELERGDVRALLAQHFAEMRAGSPPSSCHVLRAEGLADPAIGFFTLRDRTGLLLGCGALKRLSSNHGEIKSMRTADAALGQGVGGALLDHLTAMARDAGMTRLSLETGNSAMFAAATRLYQRRGFTRCGPYGNYHLSDFTAFYTREI